MTRKAVRALMAQMKDRFPADMAYVVSLDQTQAVTEGMREILLTLGIALVLVIVVVYIFLQGWRATLIPLLAVPVSLVGTFAFFPAVRLLHQYAFDVRAGARHRPGGGRCDRRRRGCRAPYRRRRGAESSRFESHGGDFRARHWHCFGALGGIRADRIHTGNHGALVPAIRGYDRDLRPHFGIQCAQPQPGSRRAAASPKEAQQGAAEEVFRLRSIAFLRTAPTAYIRVSGALIRKSAVAVVALLLFGAAAVFFGEKLPSGFLPDEDHGLRLRQPSASCRRFAPAHGSSRADRLRRFSPKRPASNTRPASSASAC